MGASSMLNLDPHTTSKAGAWPQWINKDHSFSLQPAGGKFRCTFEHRSSWRRREDSLYTQPVHFFVTFVLATIPSAIGRLSKLSVFCCTPVPMLWPPSLMISVMCGV